ncbi:cytochrome C [candidate division KSB1 bacterium]|nr:MAG: cytochrome C [candidate division KSB1 bacterium]MBC6949258.1 cytochrome C [candidate division KSB1 bacterium]MCE7943471.1 cytochrome C [Chlorobi bacterium CHB1]MDL1877544.1 cytochrome C [Cytophagia bacterium CHB2]
MTSLFKKAGIVLLAALVIVQFLGPAKTNPPVEEGRTLAANLTTPPEIQTLLKRACADCHSHETAWPWYSHVAPASWFVINHVNDGRRHLNFSDWAKYTPKQASHKLEEIEDLVKRREMPLQSYLLLHSSHAQLSDQDIQTLSGWAKDARSVLDEEISREP